jgi:hypothetical protein
MSLADKFRRCCHPKTTHITKLVDLDFYPPGTTKHIRRMFICSMSDSVLRKRPVCPEHLRPTNIAEAIKAVVAVSVARNWPTRSGFLNAARLLADIRRFAEFCGLVSVLNSQTPRFSRGIFHRTGACLIGAEKCKFNQFLVLIGDYGSLLALRNGSAMNSQAVDER